MNTFSSFLLAMCLGAFALCEASSLAPSNHESCEPCKAAVLMVRDFLGRNETEQTIEAALSHFCNMIPDGGLRPMCRSFVKDVVPVLVDQAHANMDPNSVCSLVGMCSNQLRASDLMAVQQNASQVSYDLCKGAVLEVRNFLGRNETLEATGQVLNHWCAQLASNSAGLARKCTYVVGKYLPPLMQLAHDNMDPKSVCTLLGMGPLALFYFL